MLYSRARKSGSESLGMRETFVTPTMGSGHVCDAMYAQVTNSFAARERHVNSANIQVSADRTADVLGSVCKKGVKLWSENGKLHYRAPKGALTQEEIECLRASRGRIVALLEGTADTQTIAEPRLEPRPQLACAPLAFSQLAHWNLYQLSRRRAIRQIASAMRLRGRLDVGALQKGLAEILCRHDALRTRIVVVDGVPVQQSSGPADCELRVDDLTTTSGSVREAEVIRIIEQHVLEPIDVGVGPLFGARLLRLRDNEHVLIMAMEHMISDAFSMGILLRDLFTAYVKAVKGHAFSLPAIPVQFADYAVWQRNAQRSWIQEHGKYWNERVAGCQRLRFPEDQNLQTASHEGWGVVPLKIGRELKAELREWCRLRRTTLVMSVFTAYVGLVLCWCDVSEAMVQYVTDGRISPKIENTIGFFASTLYLRIGLLEDDSFVDLMNRVTGEYCQAHEHADSSYMAAQVPRPEFTRNPLFNWVPDGSKIDLSALDASEDAITCSPIRFAHPMLKELALDHEPVTLLYDTDDEVVGDVHFSLNRFSVDTMERFGRNFLMFVGALLREPEGRVKDIFLL